MKRATGNSDGTSFHGVTIMTTPRKLIELAENLEADYGDWNTGEDKTNFDFEFETDDGVYFTVYDWKEYRPLRMDENIKFHIGGEDKRSCVLGLSELRKNL